MSQKARSVRNSRRQSSAAQPGKRPEETRLGATLTGGSDAASETPRQTMART